MNLFAIASLALLQAQNPFAPPRASLHYAPDRVCDLTNVTVDLNVDYPTRTYTGRAVDTMSPLRDGITQVTLHAGALLEISRVTVDDSPATYKREGRVLMITVPRTVRGKSMRIGIDYKMVNSKAQPFGGLGGFHWIEPQAANPGHVGFWTQGETESNSEWAPTWDYPNDLTTSETRTTVQADWDVIGNGSMISNTLSAEKTKRTVVWRMTQPHATYLLSLCGGPFDIKKDKWEGVDLWYVVPRGEGKYIDDSFGDTKDMLSFYSGVLGVKYAWPKYAEDAMYDFGGGMENVSATTLGANSLTEAREGFRRMASLNAHELGHQWFGDLVTCKDWGDTWLNESFATFMETIYMEHSRGKNAYDQEIDDNTRGYLAEAKRYKRPISTKMYPSGDAMFDSHTYPKGGVLLHTLRRYLGDKPFYDGLNYYLTKWRHTPVESAQLRRSMTEATGINCEPFWAQWIEKPGHPVLDYAWTYDNAAQEVVLTVKQTQDTNDGTPIYDIATKVALIPATGTVMRAPVHLSQKEDTFRIKTVRPGALILDPDHDFLREIPTLHWPAQELPLIMQMATDSVDRAEAMRMLLANSPSDATIQLVAASFRADNSAFPAFRSVRQLSAMNRPELRSLWLEQLTHPNLDRRAEAVTALAGLPADPATTQRLRSMINGQEGIQAVVNAINALAKWDKKGNEDVFRKALTIPSHRDRLKRAAEAALAPG